MLTPGSFATDSDRDDPTSCIELVEYHVTNRTEPREKSEAEQQLLAIQLNCSSATQQEAPKSRDYMSQLRAQPQSQSENEDSDSIMTEQHGSL